MSVERTNKNEAGSYLFSIDPAREVSIPWQHRYSKSAIRFLLWASKIPIIMCMISIASTWLLFALLLALSPLYLIMYPFLAYDYYITDQWGLDEAILPYQMLFPEDISPEQMAALRKAWDEHLKNNTAITKPMYNNWYDIPSKGHWDITDPSDIKEVELKIDRS